MSGEWLTYCVCEEPEIRATTSCCGSIRHTCELCGRDERLDSAEARRRKEIAENLEKHRRKIAVRTRNLANALGASPRMVLEACRIHGMVNEEDAFHIHSIFKEDG